MSSTIVEIPSVGPVTIVKSQRAKHLRITETPQDYGKARSNRQINRTRERIRR